ncbi:MAG: beta-galactosidase [Proteobacteria bacterium]|nr:beta-galactosidase [Pseudomonadota bacterium]
MTDGVLRFGADYYPEHWPETRWTTDARLMREASFNVVRLAEFAWSKLEPREGEFDFSWLDRAIAVLHDQGIDVVLGTPTASPPMWVMKKHPDAYRVLEDGRRLTFGHRRHYCPNHEGFRESTRSIVAAMAEHYAANKAVIGWQTDNEFGDRCYCGSCGRAFARWLAKRHGSIDTLNERWGTVFWSQEYENWDDIQLPSRIARAPNPGLQLDYFRFSSDSYVDYQNIHIDILRRLCPDQWITHNLMGFKYDQIDYFDLAAPLDFVSWDNYPRLAWAMVPEVDVPAVALASDTMRGLKRKGFWVMEAQSGSGGWEDISVAPRPGEIRLWAWQAIAHGADGIIFFRWRTARVGAEQYWHGILDHHGEVGRRYEEVRRMGAELARVGGKILPTQPRAEVALMLSYDSRFAFQAQGNNPAFSYPGHLRDIYAAFHRLNVMVDVVSPEADLAGYRIVLAPALHVLPAATADRLRAYVEAGGVLLGTARTGVKGIHNEVVDAHLPGLLRDVFGVRVEEYDSPALGVATQLRAEGAGQNLTGDATANGWCDILAPEGATPLMVYEAQHYLGRAAVTEHRFGQGLALYAGTFGNAALHDHLASRLLDAAGLAEAMRPAPEGIELCWRQGDDGTRLLFVLNHGVEPRSVVLTEAFVSLIDGLPVRGETVVGAHDVLLLRTGGNLI